MRSRRSHVAIMHAIALIVLVASVAGCTSAPENSENSAAQEETRLKQYTVLRDVKATEQLSKLDCERELQALLSNSQQEEKREHQIQTLLASHPHIVRLEWITSDEQSAAKPTDKLEPAVAEQLKGAMDRARAKLANGESFDSGNLHRNETDYTVLAVPSPEHKGEGLISVLDHRILGDVQRHQRRNMRLVPYPAEGRYRTESVVPNTTHDVTVTDGEANGDVSHYHTNEVVVRFTKDPDAKGMDQIQREIGVKDVRKLGYTFVFRSHTMSTQQLMAYFERNWQPIYVEPHYLYITNMRRVEESSGSADLGASSLELEPIIPNDALYSDYQWNLSNIMTETGWNVSKGGEDVIIAVLDTGVQSDHPDLAGQLTTGYNVIDGSQSSEDDVGHGTHVAGIIGAAVNNNEGVAGISWYNKIMPVKVLDSSGAGTTYSVAEGIIWATDNGAKVINMSLGNYASAQFLHDAIRYAYDRDVVLIAASGNDNTSRPGYPAAYPEVFAVAATDAHEARAPFSNYGDYIDVAAPGDGIASTYPGSQYAALSGTSMAAPHVAGLAGLIRTKNPLLTNEEVMEVMRSTAKDLGKRGKDEDFGYGQIDVIQALQAASGSSYESMQEAHPLRSVSDILDYLASLLRLR
ncbi:S8 family peptidase [Paenibacillus daejeonensis]|uniref:S8 family peptidase n=1 Tax=Paenibacillus daejeonensis TaxID=135193 RepID=UPI0003795EF0|nr:S8 family peptidase [Paenibacillus daejeonensis]